MHRVTYSLSVSLDGFMKGPDGGFAWGAPDPDLEVFRFATDEVRGVHTHLLGRQLYESMVYWEAAQEDWGPEEREFARLWRALPKVVFSSTLTEVVGNTRLATGGLADEIARLKAEPGDGDIAIGGAELAHAAADLDLIDEYRLRIHPVLVGGGTPFFSRNDREVALDLVDTRTFACGVVHTRHRVVR